MAASVNFQQNTYSGELLNDLLSYTVQGNDTYRYGLIHIKAGVQYRGIIPRIELSDIIQDNKPTPVSPTDSKGQYTFTERYLEPEEFMVYLEFNPRDFEKYWKPYQPQNALVFRTLDPRLQAKMLRLLIEKKNEWFGDAIWQSVKGSGGVTGDATITPPAGGQTLGVGTYKYFDGVMKRIMESLKSGTPGDQVVLAGDAILTDGQQVEAALYSMWQKTPSRLRNRQLTYVMSWDLWDKYDQYLTSNQFKYVDNTTINQRMFKGKRVLAISGIPEQTIVLANFQRTSDSNLWGAVDYASDQDIVKVERLQANSELYFFQMRMKMDVNIVLPGDMVVWTSYKNV